MTENYTISFKKNPRPRQYLQEKPLSSFNKDTAPGPLCEHQDYHYYQDNDEMPKIEYVEEYDDPELDRDYQEYGEYEECEYKFPDDYEMLLLCATSCSPDSVGAALINPGKPGLVVIVGFNLPWPQEFGSDFESYKAWVIDPKFNRYLLDMNHIGGSVWMAYGQNKSLEGFTSIIVTPEPSGDITIPTGPAVLEGELGGSSY